MLAARRIGLAGALSTARDVYWEPLAARLSGIRLILHNRRRLVSPLLDVISPEYVRKHKTDMLLRGRDGYKADAGGIWTDSAAGSRRPGTEIVLGEIDQDGFVCSEVGPLAGIPTVSVEEFVPRTRFGLTLVCRDGVLAVRKDYRGHLAAFLRELHALDVLARAKCNVPALLDFDLEALQIVQSYIAGAVLRESLASFCPVVRDRDVAIHEIGKLEPRQQRMARIREAQKVLPEVVDDDFVEQLFRQLRIMHAHRFVWGDIKYGNVIIEKRSGNPYIIDLEQASHHPRLGKRTFQRLVDADIEKFNLHFGTRKLTTDRLRQLANAIPPDDVYAPACFAAGITIGDLWDNGCGYGRWHYLLDKALPPMQGARILDLGANNGFTALQLLRSGASEVVGIELDEKYFEQGAFLREAFQYTDGAEYRFQYIHGNMKDIGTMELGRFDFVMALCCIYYLDDDAIAAVARYVSSITNTFVLQCNTSVGIDRKDDHVYVKASVEYAQKVLALAGFTDIEITAPRGYKRPLVIGRRPSPKRRQAADLHRLDSAQRAT